MKRKTLFFLHLLITCTFLYSNEATIEKVMTFSNPSKTSLVIHYSGTEKLRFFALDAADGVFALDLPGVFSKFDFSTLVFDQVDEVIQAALDPDVNKGISVRFMLKERVDYQLFEGGPGELTLFFETMPPAPEVAENRERFTEPKPVEPVLPPASPVAEGFSPLFQKDLQGEYGPLQLSRLVARADEHQGQLFLTVGALENYKYFFLENPKRFVLDLTDTVLSLPANEISMNLPLVSNIRIRQFQSHPTPVTRMVLDLEQETNVNIVKNENGLRVDFAESQEQLAMLGEQNPALPTTNPISDGELSLDHPAPQQARANLPAPRPVFEEEVVSEDADLAADRGATALAESAAAFERDEPVVDLQEEPSDQVQAPAEQLETASNQVPGRNSAALAEGVFPGEPDQAEPAVALTEAKTSVTEVAETIASPTEPGSLSAAFEAALEGSDLIDEPSQALPEPNTTPARADEALSRSETAAERVPEAMVQAAVGVVDDPEIADPSETKLSEPVATFKAGVGPEQAQVTSPELDLSEIYDAQESDSAQTAARQSEDLDIEAFLDKNDPTLYEMMKDVRSNRSSIGQVIVTNNRIEDAKVRLVEMKPMQDDEVEEPGQEDFANIFQGEGDDTYETIDGGNQEYRGFEISIIDVKDANIRDLLRFIADQVGINLFVDSSVGDITATYRFRNIPWDHALDIILTNANLDKEFRNGVLRVATTEKFRQEEQARLELKLQRELSVPRDTVTFPLNYAKAEDVAPIIEDYLSPRGTILQDQRTNLLIINDIPKKMTAIRALIKKLDRQIEQVVIEARIVETTTRFLRELGIQWGLTSRFAPEFGTETGLDFPHRIGVEGPRIGQPRLPGIAPEGGYAINFPVVAENPSGFGLTLGNFLDNFKLDISLQLLESEGHGQIISSPKVTTQNNKTALIKNGQRIPIQTIQRGTITTRFIDAVLELQVTPHITSDETIIMDLIIDKSEPDFTRTVNGNPIINISRAETQVLVKNGGTAVIGGIFSLNEQNNENGIPGMRNVPFLRRLFGNELRNFINQELLIFITPRIVKY